MRAESNYRQQEAIRGRTLAAATMAMVALAGCSSENQPAPDREITTITALPTTSAPEQTTLPETPATTQTTRTGASCELQDGTKDESFARFEEGHHVQQSKLIGMDVRLGDHHTNDDCYERVTLQFDRPDKKPAEWPGVHARYKDVPLGDPSGELVDVLGKAYLTVTVGSWMYPEKTLHDGPSRVSREELKKVDIIKDVVMTENNEGRSTWTIGLDKERDYRLQENSGTKDCPDLCVVLDIEDN